MRISANPSSLTSPTAKVSARGRIVIPVELRRKYHIEPGAEVRIVDYGGVLGLVPVVGDPIREGRRSLASKVCTEKRPSSSERSRGRFEPADRDGKRD